ncbi:MAG: DUF1697 domain-containing protein [Thiohalomonadales bacterium]
MNYISILRGINVSGQKKIKMADLKLLFESLGFENVVTYIQSGNVLFNTKTKNKADLKSIIEQAIKKTYKFHVPVIIRSKNDFKKIINNLPFKSIDTEKNGTIVLVTFLSDKPSKDKYTEIQQYVKSPEKLVIKDKEVYLYCPNGYGKSKLSNNFIENKLSVEATTRSWKSIHKIYDLAE